MPRLRFSILVLLPCMFTACNFFLSYVPVDDKDMQRQLVVTARFMPDSQRIYVGHSLPIGSGLRFDTTSLPNTSLRLYVNDASVYTPVFTGASDRNVYFDARGIFIPNDRLRLEVSHPDYPSMYAETICPESVPVSIVGDSINRASEAFCTIRLAAYHADTNAVVTLESGDNYIYSYDIRCARFTPHVIGTAYYADKQLTLPVSVLTDTTAIHTIIKLNRRPKNDMISEPDTTKLVITCTARPKADYSYYTTIKWANSPYNTVPTLSIDTVEDYSIGNIFETISESFDVIGGAEGYQVVGNFHSDDPALEHPLGCFSVIQQTSDSCLVINYGNGFTASVK